MERGEKGISFLMIKVTWREAKNILDNTDAIALYRILTFTVKFYFAPFLSFFMCKIKNNTDCHSQDSFY